MSGIDLDGACVVIMGASSGIGQATAEAFARAGSRLVLCARGAAALQRVARRCRDLGGEAIVVVADVTDPEAAKQVVETALAYGGRIDVWVSNAGVGAVGRFDETPVEAHRRVVHTNLVGHINDAHAVMPVFLRQRRGIFVNMISLGGFAALPYAAAYSASKFGLRGFSEALRAELVAEPDIHVCDVYPAFIDTPGIAHGANYVGRALTAPPPLSDARRVAAAIVGLARRPRPSAAVGLATHLVRLGHAVAPNLSAGLMAAFMRSYFARAPRAPIGHGNLYQPAAVAGGIDGGLRSPRQRGYALAGLAFLAGTALLVTALNGKRHRSRSGQVARRMSGARRPG